MTPEGDAPAESPAIEFATLRFRGLTEALLLDDSPHLKIVVPVNAELVVLANRNPRFREIVNRNLATFDGYWPFLFARLKNPGRHFEKISGSDFVSTAARVAAAKKKRVFLLGAEPRVNQSAAAVLRSNFSLDVDGFSPPVEKYPMRAETNGEILSRIETFSPQVLLVAFGAPKQEFWIDDHADLLRRYGVELAMAVGGSFNMLAGVESRAPKPVQAAGFEWLWRLGQNPRARGGRFLRSLRFFVYALRC